MISEWTGVGGRTGAWYRPGTLFRALLGLFVPPPGQKNRPTKAGWMLILVAIGMGTAAYNTASNILFLVLSFVLAVLIVNGILSVLNFRRLGWRFHYPERMQVGVPSGFTVELRNGKRVLPTYAVWFNIGVGVEPRRVSLRGRLAPGETLRLAFEHVPRTRGKVPLVLGGVESRFPFGFLSKRMGLPERFEAVTWPARSARLPRLPPVSNLRDSGGVSRRVGEGTDLLQLRGYRPGDPPKWIHWKATARTGKIMIRQMAEEGLGGYWLGIEPSPAVWRTDEEFEEMIRCVFSLAEHLHHRGRLLGYLLAGSEPVAVRQPEDLYRFNDLLATLQPGAERLVANPAVSPLLRFRPTDAGGIQARLFSAHETALPTG